jgi:hypothetical protein
VAPTTLYLWRSCRTHCRVCDSYCPERRSVQVKVKTSEQVIHRLASLGSSGCSSRKIKSCWLPSRSKLREEEHNMSKEEQLQAAAEHVKEAEKLLASGGPFAAGRGDRGAGPCRLTFKSRSEVALGNTWHR